MATTTISEIKKFKGKRQRKFNEKIIGDNKVFILGYKKIYYNEFEKYFNIIEEFLEEDNLIGIFEEGEILPWEHITLGDTFIIISGDTSTKYIYTYDPSNLIEEEDSPICFDFTDLPKDWRIYKHYYILYCKVGDEYYKFISPEKIKDGIDEFIKIRGEEEIIDSIYMIKGVKQLVK